MNGWTVEGDAWEGTNVQAVDGVLGELFDACQERFYYAKEPWLRRAAEGDVIQKIYSTDTGIAMLVSRFLNDAKNYVRSHDESGNELSVDYYKDNPYTDTVNEEEWPRPLRTWGDGEYPNYYAAMVKILSGDSSRKMFRRVLGSLPSDWKDWSDPAFSETLYNTDQMNIGDIFGAWTFRDLQEGLNLTIWRPIPISTYTYADGYPYGFRESKNISVDGRNYYSREDAQNLAIEKYNNATPDDYTYSYPFAKYNRVYYGASSASTYPLTWVAILQAADSKVLLRNIPCRGQVRIYGIVNDYTPWQPADWFNTGYSPGEVVTLYAEEVDAGETDTDFMFNMDIPLPFDESSSSTNHNFDISFGNIGGSYGYQAGFAKHNIAGGFQFY